MDLWQRARSLAEETAKRSQELTQGIGSMNFSDVVSEASKRSKEFATEASKRSKEIATEASKRSKEFANEASKKSKEFAVEALKRANQLTAQIPTAATVLTNIVDSSQKGNEAADLDKYGITDDLRDFIRGITICTFQDFPLEDDSEMSDIPARSNVRQDLNEWQERHAKLVLSTVKDMSKLRYQLCPRVMKERKFWRIYFILVNSHVAPYEKRYLEDLKLKSEEKAKDTEVKEVSSDGTSSKKGEGISKPNSNKSSTSEQDLDVFLLGDLEDSDNGPDDAGDDFDDDFDKI
ncbi:uncharacterized protein LOC142529899 [Primulina tabacum]|uniref:uncharacterized protein LOC142529899 n=1 Tax=Primulina tabacum TaxID=48773 RepID=UPI003F592DB2